MPFVEARMADAPEEELPKEGSYDLRITNKETYTSDKGRVVTRCFIDIEAGDGVEYQTIVHHLVMPNESDWETQPDIAKMMLRGVKRFLSVFGVEMTPKGFDDDNLDGAVGRCLVVIGEYKGEDNPQLKLPRMAD